MAFLRLRWPWILTVLCVGLSASATEREYIKPLYSAPLTLDPTQMNDTASLVASTLLYDGLFSFTPDLEIVPRLVERWDVLDNGKRFRFRLRVGAQFHDGTPVLTGDVIASFGRLLEKSSKVWTAYDMILGAKAFHSGASSSVAGLKRIDDRNFEIILNVPFPPFLSVLAGATAKVLPASASKSGFFALPVGSGPFRLASRVAQGEQLTLFRFENYYGKKPELPVLKLVPMHESEAIANAIAGKVHDLANFPLAGGEEVFSRGKHLVSPSAATWIVGLNVRKSPFDDLSVRRAFIDDIETEKFRIQFYPTAMKANGYIPPGLPGYEPSYKSSQRPPSTLTRAQKRAVSLQHPIVLSIPVELRKSKEMAAFFANTLSAKGWIVEVKTAEWVALMKGYSEKSLQAFLVSMNMDYPDTEFILRNFESSNPDNFSGFKSPRIDSLLAEARSTPDRAARHQIYVKLIALLNDAAVTANLFHPRAHIWVHPCVSGMEPNLLSDVYIDYRDVALNTACGGQRVSK